MKTFIFQLWLVIIIDGCCHALGMSPGLVDGVDTFHKKRFWISENFGSNAIAMLMNALSYLPIERVQNNIKAA